MKAICENCGKTFERKKLELEKYEHHFCSRKCVNEWKKENNFFHGENSPRWNSVKVKCEYCGKLFYRTRSEFQKHEHHFCSRKCFDTWKKKRSDVKCDNCGKVFSRTKFAIARSKHQFCSRECYIEWRAKTGIFKAKKHPNWQGGISFGSYCVKFNEELKEKVREKYGRRCFLCGKTEKENKRKLSVHHVDYNKGRGCNGKRWLLVPLCLVCHGRTDYNRDYWEPIIRAKIRKRKLSHSQTILDVYF